MSGPQRKADQTGISVSMSKTLLAQIDGRARSLNLTRSQYLAQLARNDLADGGNMTLRETKSHSNSPQNEKAVRLAEALKPFSKSPVPPK